MLRCFGQNKLRNTQGFKKVLYFRIGKYFFTSFASLTFAYHYLMKLIKYNH